MLTLQTFALTQDTLCKLKMCERLVETSQLSVINVTRFDTLSESVQMQSLASVLVMLLKRRTHIHRVSKQNLTRLLGTLALQ